jgi:hypothetical protein
MPAYSPAIATLPAGTRTRGRREAGTRSRSGSPVRYGKPGREAEERDPVLRLTEKTDELASVSPDAAATVREVLPVERRGDVERPPGPSATLALARPPCRDAARRTAPCERRTGSKERSSVRAAGIASRSPRSRSGRARERERPPRGWRRRSTPPGSRRGRARRAGRKRKASSQRHPGLLVSGLWFLVGARDQSSGTRGPQDRRAARRLQSRYTGTPSSSTAYPGHVARGSAARRSAMRRGPPRCRGPGATGRGAPGRAAATRAGGVAAR